MPRGGRGSSPKPRGRGKKPRRPKRMEPSTETFSHRTTQKEGAVMAKPTDSPDVPLHSVEVTDQEEENTEIHIVVDELIEESEEDDGVVTGRIETDAHFQTPPFEIPPTNLPEARREVRPPFAGLKVFDFDTLAIIQNAHDKVAAVIREGSSSLPKAFTSNLARDRQNWKDGLAGTLLGGAVAFAAGDPIFFIFTAPLGFMIRNAWNTARIRSKKDKLTRRDVRDMENADLPELKSAWDLTCYKFIRLVRGYNARVHAVNRIRENHRKDTAPELLSIADKWDALLGEVFERLDDVRAELQRHQTLLISRISEDLEELDDSLRSTDLLGYFDGVPLLDWLDLDRVNIKNDRILLSQDRQVFRADMEARAELQDRNERRKEAVVAVEDFLQGSEPVFDDLEREHGAAVRAIQEDANDDPDDDS